MSFVCPVCKGALVQSKESYSCTHCGRAFPVVCGIPDFRLHPDPYIGLAEDRAKGARLAEAGQSRTFEELLRHYYSITPEDPPDLAKHWIARSLAEVTIARFTFEHYGLAGNRFLDLGCSTGAMLAAASASCREVTGVDVAFRWLVVGAARLRELGVQANLVCANAEHLPFAPESFDSISAIDLLEHTRQPRLAVQEAFRVSRPGAKTVYRINNRFTLLPEPHVHMWGVGMLPRAWQAAYVAARRRDLHRYQIELLSGPELNRLCRQAGYKSVVLSAAVLHGPQFTSQLAQRAIATYNAARSWPVTGELLKRVGPLLACVAER